MKAQIEKQEEEERQQSKSPEEIIVDVALKAPQKTVTIQENPPKKGDV